MKSQSIRSATGLSGLSLVVLLTMSGCAEQLGAIQQGLPQTAGILVPGAPAIELGTGEAKQPAVAPAKPVATQPTSTASPASSNGAAIADEPFDPFAQAEEAAGGDYDPLEPLNTKVFEFNRQVDRFVLKPVAQGYDFIVPDLVQLGISNMIYNLRFAPRFFNNVFQGKAKGAGIEVGRFLINSTVGIGGFFDVAKEVDLLTPEEDLGQTLGFYGVKPGPYLVLPFLQPFTVRDLFGYVGDIFLNPINWLVVPIIEVDGVPSVISHANRTTSGIIQLSVRVGEIVNDRSRNLEKFQGVEEATLDLYTAVRNAYLQKRALSIKE